MYILFDIGGTKTRIATTEDFVTYSEPVKFDTLKKFDDGIDLFISTVRGIAENKPMKALAGGMRGILNREKTRMVNDPGKALLDWAGRPLAEMIEKAFNAPVFLEYDTAVVGLGEAVHGAGKGYDIVAYHTVSTGVGGVRIVNGRVDISSHGFEPGHQILDIDRTLLGEHTTPTLENLVSGTALQERRGVKPYEIAQDDHVWDQLAGYLAYGLKNTVTYWSPDIIVLGGSMIVGDPRIFLEDIVRHTKEIIGEQFPCPEIVDATLKDEGGLYGAMALLAQNVSKE